MRHFSLLLLLTLLPLAASAQLKGTVLTADSQPAAYATVLLYADSNTAARPLAYALTTADGHFSLAADVNDLNWLVVRQLGSKEYRRQLGPLRQVDIRLEADVRSLDAVTVESTYVPVSVHGDTISFNTDFYRTGTEETAAEVLQQIPGMEVSESGEVSFGGKTVDKVLVDGRDIFASGSDGTLNTLPADAIRGADLLRNYRSGSLIDQFSGRELTALNLRTDGRHRLAGRLGASGGVVGKWRSDASLLYMGKTVSLTSILGANNNGEALFSLEDYIKTFVGLDNLLSSGGANFSPSEEELSMLMPPSNVYASRSGLATLSGTWTPNDRFRMKGNLLLNGTDLDAASLAVQQYLAFNATQRRSHDEHSRSLFASGHLQQTWRPNDRLELNHLTQLSRTSLASSDSLDESGLTDMFASEDNQLEKRQLKEELALNLKTGSRSLLSAHLALGNSRRNYSYHLLTASALLPYVPYSTDPDGTLRLDTRRRISDLTLAPDINYAFNLTRRLTLTASASLGLHRSAFRYGETVDRHIDWRSASASLRLSRKRGLLRFDLGAELRHTDWRTSIVALPDSARVDILPSATVSLNFSETHQLSLSASLSADPVELEYLLRDTLVSSYSSLRAGSDITDPFAASANIHLNYFFFDLFSNTMVVAMAGLTDSRFAVRPHSVQDSSIASLARYAADGSMQMRFANASLRQGLGRWPVDLTLAANLTRSVTASLLNGSDNEMHHSAYGATLALASRRKAVVNAELGASANLQHSEYTVTESHLREAAAHAALMMAWPRFTARLQLAYSHVEGGADTRNLWDLGLRAEYKAGAWRVTLRGGNLLHLRSQEWIASDSTPLFLSTSTYRRLPGYLLLGLAYRF